MRLSKQSDPVEFDRYSRRRQLWGRLLGLFAVIVIGAAGLFFFPPAFFGPRVNQQWRPGCEEVQTSWTALAHFYGLARSATDCSATGGFLLRELDSTGSQLVLVRPNGDQVRSPVFSTGVSDALELNGKILAIGTTDPWGSARPQTLALVVMDAESLAILSEHKLEVSPTTYYEITLHSTPDGGALAYLSPDDPAMISEMVLIHPDATVGATVQLPLPFDLSFSGGMLDSGLLWSPRTERAHGSRSWNYDSGFIVVDPQTGLELTGAPLEAALAMIPDLREPVFDSGELKPAWGCELITEGVRLARPTVGFLVLQSVPDSSSPSKQDTSAVRAIRARRSLWSGIENTPAGDWLPGFDRWTTPVEEIIHGTTMKSWPAEFGLAQSVFWTEGATDEFGLNLFEYNSTEALVTQVVYPSPARLNGGKGILRYGFLKESDEQVAWVGWTALPDGYRHAPHLPLVGAVATQTTLGVSLSTVRLGGRSMSNFNDWVCEIPYPPDVPRPPLGSLVAGTRFGR